MRTSLINCCKLSLSSAVRYAGSTEGEFYQLYNDNPPAWFSLADLHKLAGDKIKSGEHDTLWFNSQAAQIEPILKHNIDRLLDIMGSVPTVSQDDILMRKQTWEDLSQDFRTLLPPNPTIGSSLDTLRIIAGKYEKFVSEISVFVSRLSYAGFFEI